MGTENCKKNIFFGGGGRVRGGGRGGGGGGRVDVNEGGGSGWM